MRHVRLQDPNHIQWLSRQANKSVSQTQESRQRLSHMQSTETWQIFIKATRTNEKEENYDAHLTPHTKINNDFCSINVEPTLYHFHKKKHKKKTLMALY